LGATVGAISVLDSGGELDVVVGVLLVGVGDVVVVAVVVEGLVGAGLLPPLPCASKSKP
jgi:hypothetical protein